MREELVRGAFSVLAGAVFLATSAEWCWWSVEQKRYWKFIPAFFLGCMAVFEAMSVWKRVDRLIERIP